MKRVLSFINHITSTITSVVTFEIFRARHITFSFLVEI